jgi:hypothetical protein
MKIYKRRNSSLVIELCSYDWQYFYHSLLIDTTIKSCEVLFSKGNDTIHFCVDCKIFPFIGIETHFVFISFLSNKNVTSFCGLSSVNFETTKFCLGISKIFGTTCRFFMSHVLV